MSTPLGDERRRLLSDITHALGRRRLVYYGIRGSDALAFRDIEQLSEVISLTDESADPTIEATSAERLAGLRIDLDNEVRLPAQADAQLVTKLAESLGQASAVISYRPTQMVREALLRAGDRCLSLALFDTHQRSFEYKPWVDRELAARGIPTLGWRVIRDADRAIVDWMLRDGPLVARVAESSGGAGIAPVHQTSDFDTFTAQTGAQTVSVSAYREDAIPVNIGGVVWPDGGTTIHPLSLQLVGIESLTGRVFGYCGNDFAAAVDLPASVLDEVEQRTREIGRWLAGKGYLGAFGIDYLLSEDQVVFCEVNPRFQGSSSLSDRLTEEIGLPGLGLEHVGAFLGLTPPTRRPPLRELMRSVPRRSQAVLHNLGPDLKANVARVVERVIGSDPRYSAELVLPDEIVCAHNAVLARVIYDGTLTTDGRSLAAEGAPLRHLADALHRTAGSSPGL